MSASVAFWVDTKAGLGAPRELLVYPFIESLHADMTQVFIGEIK